MIGGTTALARNIISGNGLDGIAIIGDGSNTPLNVTIQGNYIGTDISGVSSLGNARHGVNLFNGAAGNTIGGAVNGAGNLISGNTSIGVYVEGANNAISGNLIGLNASGTAAIANSYGVYINNVGGNTIGGTTAAARNVISGNTNDGVFITGASATNNLIQGNYIGTNAAGTAAIGNGAMGVRISGSAAGNTIGGAIAGNLISGNANSGVYIDASNTTVKGNLIGTNAAGTGAIRNGSLGSATGGIFIASGTGSVIGGTTAADRNVIAGNGGAGLWIEGTTGSHTIQGNYIGVDITGDTALSNTRWGIVLNSGAMTNIQIGGTAAGAGNVISGNEASTGGLFIGGHASGTVIEGNRIGVGATTNTALGTVQAAGIRVQASATNTRIGGTAAGAGNIIARNGSVGVTIVGNTSGTTIQGNAIYGNNGLAIDLGGDGATTNDGALTNGQPNQLMDTPVLANANLVGNDLTLSGYVGSAAGQATFANSRVEFFKTTASSSVFLGALTTDSSGNFSGTLDVTGLGLLQSDAIIATATEPNGNTSEFSVSFEANATPTANADSNTAVEAGGTLNGSAGTNPTGNVLANDTDPNATDTKTVSGVAAGTVASASGSVAASVAGSYGSIQIAANGSYTYTVDNNNSVVQALRTSGQTLTDVFTYTMRDTGGLTSTAQVTITIEGANDAPVAVADNGSANEAGGLANGTAGSDAVGNVLSNDTDVDAGDTKTVAGVAAGTVASASGSVGASVIGTYGSVSLAADGSYTYTVDNANAAVQALRTSGQSLADVFSYTVVDTAGLSSTTQLTITINGANDAPTAVADTTIAVEAGGSSNGTAGTNPSGNVLSNDTDPDSTLNGETKTIAGVAAGTIASASGSVASSVVGTYGSITIAANGAYTYSVDNANSAVQALRTSSDTLTDVFTYTMTDAGGVASTAQITVTIQGANDAPVAFDDSSTAVESGGTANGTPGSNATGNVLSNDTDVDAGDTKAVHGVVAGVQATAVGSVASSVTGNYGSITIAADGSYTYVVDESNSTVQALRTSGQSITDVFTYSVIDTGGLTHAAQVTITIQGSNDAPTPVADTATAVEAGGANNGTAGSNPAGNLLTNDADVDSGDTKTVSGVAAGVQASTAGSVAANVTGSYGSINVAANGSYVYTVDNTNSAVQALRTTGQTLTDVFTYTVTDAAGLTGTTQVTITIQGSNDTPTAVSESVFADEAGGLNNATAGSNPTGNVLSNDTDVDANANGETKAVSGVAAGVQSSTSGSVGSNVAGNYGSIVIAADGTYAYAVDNSNTAVQALRTTCQTLTDVFTYTMTDAGGLTSSAQVTVTIRGTNDTPTSAADTASATEAGGLANGTVGNNPTGNVLTNDNDVDAGDTQTVSGVAAGVQASASGAVGSSVTGTYGSIAIAADGSYTYSVDNSNAAVEALRTFADTLSDTFTYTMVDAGGLASTAQIVITIHGQNDALTAANDNVLAVEAGGLYNATSGTTPTGNLLGNDTDVDAGDTKTVIGVVAGAAGSASGAVGSSVAGSYGSLSVAADGSYTFTVDNSNAAVQSLRNTSQTLTELFTYTVQDAAGATSTATATITIQGANDTPIAVANAANAFEAGGISNNISGSDPTGNVLTNDTDVDTGDTKTIIGVAAGTPASASGSVASSVTGQYGAIVINANGSYVYSLDNNNATVEALNNGSPTLTDTFTYTMSDAAGLTSTTTIVITIHGADDLPFAIVDMDTAVEAGGLNNATPGTSATGNVTLNDIQPNGQTIIGVVSGMASSASGSVGVAVTGSYGSVVLNSDGTYTYTINDSDPNVEALLLSSDHLTDIFTYTIQDSLGYTSTTQLTITLDGANDAPVSAGDNGIAVEAGGIANATAGSTAAGNILSNDIDVDAGDTKSVIGVQFGAAASASGSVGASVFGTYGSITIAVDGSYIYTVDNSSAAVQALRTASDTLTEVFTYTMEDTAGAASTATLTITIQGANDGPVANSDTNSAFEAGGVVNGSAGVNPTGNVMSNDTDVDSVANGETKTVAGVSAGVQASASGSVGSSVSGTYGAITIAADGTYTYTVDNANPTVQALRSASDTLSDVFTYTVRDTAGATSTTQITLTIHGSNDAPTTTADVADAVEAGGQANNVAGVNPTGSVLVNDGDVDAGDSLAVSGVTAGVQSSASGSVGTVVTGSYGSIVIGSNGTYSYTVDNSNSAVQALRTYGDTLTDTFTYSIQDAAGAITTSQIAIAIHGANDDPVANSDSATATEAGGLLNGSAGVNPSGNVLANDSDVDSNSYGETKSVAGVAAGVQASAAGSVAAPVTGGYGSITIAANGTYTYTVDNSNAAVQALRTTGQTLTDVFTYTVADASGATSTAQITITIQGANDTPTAIADTALATEAGGLANAAAGTNPVGNVLTNDTDVDAGDTRSVNAVAAGSVGSATGNVGNVVSGSYGAITINSDGSYQYNVDNSHAAVQALRLSSQTLTDVFTYEVIDTAGLTSLATIAVTIQGSNDNPVAINDTGIAIEAGGTFNGTTGTDATGSVLANDTDVDSLANGETKTVTGVASGVVASASGFVASAVTGAYGSITVNADGTYSYVIDDANAAVQALRTASDTLSDVFTYTVTDAGGLTSTAQVTITIQGRDDAPVGVNDTVSAIEAGGQGNATPGNNPTGNVLTNDTDVDAGDTRAVNAVAAGAVGSATGSVGAAVTGSYGSITIGTDGSYQYNVDNSNASVQALRLNSQTLTDIFTYEVIDTAGLSSLATLTVTIQGANDNPIAVVDAGTATAGSNTTPDTPATGNVLSNDTDVDSVANGETKTVTGVAAGVSANASGNTGNAVVGQYGSLTLQAGGAYTYLVDNSNSTVQALGNGQSITDVFTYTVTDAGGLTSTTQVTITILGSNDAPVAFDDTAVAIEQSGLSNAIAGVNPTGNVLVNDTDSDAPDAKTVVGVTAGTAGSASGSVGASVVGQYGSVTLAADGTYTYTVDNSNAAVQALRLNSQTLSEVFTYTMSDTAGALSTATLTVSIHGRNDTPVASVDNGSAIEAGGIGNGTAGANATGNVMSNDADVDSVAGGETKIVTGVASGVVANSAGSVATAVSGVYGAITIQADGSYSYTVDDANAAVQALRTNSDTLDDVFTYTMTDAGGLTSTTQVTITIHGRNDTPYDLTATGMTISEASSNGQVVGSMTPSDVDSADSFTYQLLVNAGGRFAIDSTTGVVSVANASQLDYETATSHTLIVQVTDATGATFSKQFTVTLTDSNEFAVSPVTDADSTANSVNENAAAGSAVGITAAALDADATNSSVTYSLDDNDGGRFAIDTNSGVVTLATALDRESDGATRTITIRATSADGSFSVQNFTIAINDVNEFAVSPLVDADSAVNAVTENAAVGSSVGISATAADADATTNAITYSLLSNDSGRFAIDANTGVVTVASAIDREVDGPTRSITIRATSADGSFSDQSFTIAIIDSNEYATSPVIDGDSMPNSVNENAIIGSTVGVAAGAYDGDATNNAISYSLTDDDGGRFAIDATTGIVTVHGAIDREADGPVRTITIRATSADGSYSEQSVAVTIHDIDEFDTTIPVDTNVAANSVAENSANGSVVGLTAAANDLDATTNSITYTLVDDAGGRFAIDAQTGLVTVANSSLLNFEANDNHSIVVRAQSSDGSLALETFSIAVTDVNEAPVASGRAFTVNNVQLLDVDASVLASGMSDPDGDTLSVQLVSGPSHGVLVLNSDGSFQYVANAGFVGQDSFAIDAFDGQLQSSPVTVTIVVTLPPVNNSGGSSGGGSTSTSTDSSSSTRSEPSSTNTNTTTTTQTTETTSSTQDSSVPLGQDNSRIAERSMEAQQSAGAGQTEPTGTAALEVLTRSTFGEQQIASLQVGELNWSPLTVSGAASRNGESEESMRLAARRVGEMQLLATRDVSQPDQVESQDYSSLVEPAKWTVISTGVVIWAVRLGHIITTFASTASAWVYFDPLTVIQAVKEKSSDEENITEAMFETSQKKRG